MRSFDLAHPVSPEARAFHDLYGDWAAVRPADVIDVVGGFDRPWWIAGGWALDAATGTHRPHEDLDVGIFRTDVAALIDAVADRLHVWAVGSGTLLALTGADELPTGADQLWLRANARSPWLLDVLLTPDADGLWINRRDPTMRMALSAATWTDGDGIRYLNPELVLIFKAKSRRPKDIDDFARTWPILGSDARSRLVEYLRGHHADHPWLDA
ncbi:nucleotidyltransferase domain-containing protein [Gordonia sp. NPDC003424]